MKEYVSKKVLGACVFNATKDFNIFYFKNRIESYPKYYIGVITADAYRPWHKIQIGIYASNNFFNMREYLGKYLTLLKITSEIEYSPSFRFDFRRSEKKLAINIGKHSLDFSIVDFNLSNKHLSARLMPHHTFSDLVLIEKPEEVEELF